MKSPREPPPLIAQICRAVQRRPRGGAGRRSVGRAVCVEGRIAWATCPAQPEDLGTYLWRLAHLTRTQLDYRPTAARLCRQEQAAPEDEQPGNAIDLPQGSGGRSFAFAGCLALHFGMPEK